MILPAGQERERALKWSMDLGRSLDYLETRPDIDISRFAYSGISLGAGYGPRLIAVDRRFKTAILASGGMSNHPPPEVNVWNFLPRVRIPVLMLNGRDDFIFPVETHQRPFFEALGTKEPDKVFRQYRRRSRQPADAPRSHQGNPRLARQILGSGGSPTLTSGAERGWPLRSDLPQPAPSSASTTKSRQHVKHETHGSNPSAANCRSQDDKARVGRIATDMSRCAD